MNNKLKILPLAMALNLVVPTLAQAHHKPAYEQLMQAKERVANCIQMVGALISKGGGGQGDDQGDDHGDGRGHSRPGHDRIPRYRVHAEPVLENDHLATKLLVKINLSLEELAEKMDDATAVYDNDSLFEEAQEKVCRLDRRIYKANQGAKGAALLPRMGLLGPSDFRPIDQELMAIEDDFGC